MTPEQFVLWMQGFVEGSNNYNLTPSGWDTVKAKLKEVGECLGSISIPHINTQPLPPYNPQPYYYRSPSLPDEVFKVTCGTGNEPSTWKYYNNGIRVPMGSVTAAEPSADTLTGICKAISDNPELCQHYDKDVNEINSNQLERPTPPPTKKFSPSITPSPSSYRIF